MAHVESTYTIQPTIQQINLCHVYPQFRSSSCICSPSKITGLSQGKILASWTLFWSRVFDRHRRDLASALDSPAPQGSSSAWGMTISQKVPSWTARFFFNRWSSSSIKTIYKALGEYSREKNGKSSSFGPTRGGGSDRSPTFWQNFPKLNLPCNCP